MLDLKVYLKEQAEKASEAVAALDEVIATSKEEGKVEGIEIGRGQVPVPNPDAEGAQYTQEQLDQYAKDQVESAVKPLQAHVDQLQQDAQVKESALAEAKEEVTKAKEELQTAIRDEEVVRADAIKAFKADLKAKYEEQQVAETEKETGFASLLE